MASRTAGALDPEGIRMTLTLVFTTVVRNAPVSAGGEAIRFQWPSGQILARRPVVPSDPAVNDPNPRGNSRGGRGVVIAGDAIVVANYHTLEVCDRNLQVVHTFSHGNFAGIHEIMRRGERLFVASTAINAAAEVPLEAVLGTAIATGSRPTPDAVRLWWPTEEPAVCEQLGVPPTSLRWTPIVGRSGALFKVYRREAVYGLCSCWGKSRLRPDSSCSAAHRRTSCAA
jgi:hypothetical protein